MTTISIRLDEQDKTELEKLCSEMGMNLSTLYTIYTKKVLRDRKIPFAVEATPDPFYSTENMNRLRSADHEIQTGNTVTRSMSELEAMAR